MKDVELQLLVIDLGDSCVVKVEYSVPLGTYSKRWICSDGDDERYTLTPNALYTINHPFKKVRAAIDALEEKPPVPRIEKKRLDQGGGYGTDYYHLIAPENSALNLGTFAYGALSQLAGKPLPIWTPTKGEWKRLVTAGEYNPYTANPAPVTIWRYTRRKA